MPLVSARPESFTTNFFDGTYADAGGPWTIGTTGPSNALIIANGGRLDDTIGILGGQAEAGYNLAWIADGFSLWNNSQALYIGQFGSFNQLVITNGARVNAGWAAVGANASSETNTVHVTGSGSRWDCPGGLQVGGAGSGNQLWLDRGGQLFTGGDGAVGYSTPSHGNRLRIDGPGSGWTSSYQIAVGSYGSASNQCVVSGGGYLYDAFGLVGNGTGNTVLLTDPDSWWYNTSDLSVGDGGTHNQFVLTNGARAISVSAWIGGDSNVVLVVGRGSSWDTGSSRAQLVVGDSGYGNQLLVSDGGRVTSWDGIISSTNNAVTIRGAGSLWTNVNRLVVGEELGRTNQLTLIEGGRASSSSTLLAGDYGKLIVTGTGSVLSAGAALSVGAEIGAGNRLFVTEGGHVTNLLGYIGGTDSTFDPHGRNGDNVAVVSGAGSGWHNASNLVIGSIGPASQLWITNGGQVNDAFGYLGLSAQAIESLAWVADTNSLWSCRRDLFVGYEASGCRLVITNGARVESVNGYVGRRSNRRNSAEITGPGSRWQLSDSLIVGNSGFQNRLTIADGGRVRCVAGLIDGPFDPNLGTSNSVWVTGAGAEWIIEGVLTVGASSTASELRIDRGGKVIAGQVSVGSLSTFNNRLTVGDGQLVVTNAAADGQMALVRAQATLDGGLVAVDRLTMDSHSSFSPTAGTLIVNRSASVGGSQAFRVGTGNGAAALHLGSGNHSFAGGLAVAPGSTLTAAGFLNGSVSNAGSLVIGASTAALTINGPLHLAGTATAAFDLGGPLKGTQHDFLRVSNEVVFGGLLRVALIDGYVPASNSVFTLMEYAVGSGTFLNAPAGARIPFEGSDVSAVVEYDAAALRLVQFHHANPATNEIDEAWALRYFGHAPLTQAEKEADADHDGLSNEGEYWAGTDPHDASSVLRITTVVRAGASGVLIQFHCVEGKSYAIDWSPDLVAWATVESPVLSQRTPGTCEWLDDGSLTGGFAGSVQRFYRIRIR